MLPYLGSLSHLFEDHDHKTCEISQTHLHELELDCDILDYQFAPSIEISSETNGFLFIHLSKRNSLFSMREILFSIDTHDTLRGPPKV
jgi:hypothetical protein